MLKVKLAMRICMGHARIPRDYVLAILGTDYTTKEYTAGWNSKPGFGNQKNPCVLRIKPCSSNVPVFGDM